jgi:hypothetical protein
VSNSASHEIWHTVQESAYGEYGLDIPQNAIDRAEREEEADDFADAMDEELADTCTADEESAPWNNARDKVGEPASPIGDWNLPSTGTYA